MRNKVTRVDLKTLNGLCNFFGIEPGELFVYTRDAEV
jgi:DNA-binding Xre family transcriptional regulator